MAKQYRFLKNFIYRMKRQYGEPLTVIHFEGTTTDLDSGLIVKNTLNYSVQRAVVFPKDDRIKFEYDMSFIAVNKNFTYGGQFVTGVVVAMLDQDDLGPAFVPAISDEVAFRGQQYVIEKLYFYREERIVLIEMKRLEAL